MNKNKKDNYYFILNTAKTNDPKSVQHHWYVIHFDKKNYTIEIYNSLGQAPQESVLDFL